ncbi:putative serine/threonine-protein kinase iks1 [Coemansia spiralis]|uniref:non-specific serine/threonine protein kinase n=1 Tax=Coemansia spiralis TaxID=417178 RepID=A0A9W8GR15_9FUNG|nr:putative serine/threonine-protein kinase iks1 [Coemansia spiralis]
MSIRRKNLQRSRSQGASRLEQTLHQGSAATRSAAAPYSTQLIPYSPWRVILYKRPSGQAVLYNQDENMVEVSRIVSRDFLRPRLQPQLLAHGSNEGSLAIVDRNHNKAVDLQQQQHRAHICPTCLQLVSAHAAGAWESQVGVDADSGAESSTTTDREYFRLLARSMRPHRGPLVLTDAQDETGSEIRIGEPGHTLRQRARALPVAGVELDGAGYDHEVPTLMSPIRDGPRGGTVDDNDERAASDGVAASSFNQGYYERFFSEQKKLGKGLRGSVFSCQHILDGVYLGQYAVKKVAVGNNHQWLKRMLREVKLLESLRHSNVIEYKHSWLEMHRLTNFGPNVPCLFILMEYANGGNLQEYIEPKSLSSSSPLLDAGDDASTTIKQRVLQMRRLSHLGKGVAMSGTNGVDSGSVSGAERRVLNIGQIWSFFSDICSGLAHLHQLQIIHRDLKHMNLLLHWKDLAHRDTSGEVPRILLTDFGECEILSHLEKRDRTGATGTLEFMPPELIEVDDAGRFLDSYSTKSDMWSLGMVLYYLCYSRMPYPNIDDIDILRKAVLGFKHVDFAKTQRPSGAEAIPLEMRRIMQLLLNHDESKRPDVTDIIRYVNEQKSLWHSRRHDESRFELHDSDMASNGGDTPGQMTPQLRGTSGAFKRDVDMAATAMHRPGATPMATNPPGVGSARTMDPAQSLALICSPTSSTRPGRPESSSWAHGAPGGATPMSELIRRHSVGEPSYSSRQSSVDLSQWSTDDSWAEVEDKEMADSIADIANETIASDAITDIAPPPMLAMKREHEITVGGAQPSKRRRLELGFIAEPGFCLKTAILLGKMYVLQGMAPASEQQHVSLQWITALTLVISAADIRSRSLWLSLVLLGANVILICVFMSFNS